MKDRFTPTQDSMKKVYLNDKNYTVYHDEPGLVIYFYSDAKKHPCALGWRGKAYKPFLYAAYRDEVSRKSAVDYYIELYQRDAVNKKRKQAAHTLKIGDILESSWGYDQTNVDYYEVVGTKGKGVLIRHIKAKMIEDGGFMCGRCLPCPGKYVSELITYHIPNGNNIIRVDPCAYDSGNDDSKYRHQSAWPWDGKSNYVSWYA